MARGASSRPHSGAPGIRERGKLRTMLPCSAMRTLLLLVTLALVLPAAAQDVGTRQRVVLTDGRVLAGTVVSADANVLVLDVGGLRTEIPRAQIASTEPITGRLLDRDPNDTRLFITPTARTLPQGTGRFSNYLIFFPSVAYGFTGRLDGSVAASLPIDGTGFVSANVKYGIAQTAQASFAVGVSAGTAYGKNVDSGIGGTFYGLATVGSATTSATVGAYGIYTTASTGGDGSFDVGNGFGIAVGLEQQVSNSVKLMSENLFLHVVEDGGGTGGAGAVGIRFFSGRIAGEVALPVYGFTTGAGGDATFDFLPSPVPFFGLAYNFGR